MKSIPSDSIPSDSIILGPSTKQRVFIEVADGCYREVSLKHLSDFISEADAAQAKRGAELDSVELLGDVCFDDEAWGAAHKQLADQAVQYAAVTEVAVGYRNAGGAVMQSVTVASYLPQQVRRLVEIPKLRGIEYPTADDLKKGCRPCVILRHLKKPGREIVDRPSAQN